MSKLTKTRRILALDAALVAAECCGAVTPRFIELTGELAKELDEWHEKQVKEGAIPEAFGDFLELQFEAVKALASSPRAFGYDDWLE